MTGANLVFIPAEGFMDEKLVNLTLNLDGNFNDAFVNALPERISCTGCGASLIEVKKDTERKRVQLNMNVPRPPEPSLMGPGYGDLICPGCGARTPVDLRLFGAPPPRVH
jgi:hypothetical protein